MKKVVPFKKDIIFKTNLSEITSISLEHSLHYEENNLITGELVVSGEYRMTDTSPNTEEFSFSLPFDINLDDRYIVDKAVVDIDDFYYEIVNNNVLAVNIDVLIDKLEEAPLIEEPIIETIEEPIEVVEEFEPVLETFPEIIEEPRLEEDTLLTRDLPDVEDIISKMQEEVTDIKESLMDKMEIDETNIMPVKSLFDNITDGEEYATYKIYIVREGDNIESIMLKYNISREDLALYNELKEVKIGDKLIIPTLNATS